MTGHAPKHVQSLSPEDMLACLHKNLEEIEEPIFSPSGSQEPEEALDTRSKGLNPFVQKRIKGKEIFLKDMQKPEEIERVLAGMRKEIDSFT